jgi:cellulose synthase/poly-beta-1,6-N-acetylglucosamine synthase-like glycosyltransferase
MKAVLSVTGGPEADRQWSLDSDRPVVIGRGDQADLILLDTEISRRHCRLFAGGDAWRIEDLGSLNGVYVNGEKVDSATLTHGDRLRIGNSILRFHVAAEPSRAEPQRVQVARCERCGRDLPAGSTTCPVCDTRRVAQRTTTAVPAALANQFAPPKVVRVESEHTIQDFVNKHPKDTSNVVFRWWQVVWYVLVGLVLIGILNYDILYFLHVVHVLCTFYLVVIAYKLLTVFLAVIWRWDIRIRPAEIKSIPDAELPTYTILVPLYKEREVVNKIVRHIAELDYPKEKLDVKILLEPDDPQTLEAIQDSGLPPYCEVIICPDSQPRTKPKACNHGLNRACGEFCVIYDAEDRPEPDQLKKAIIGFRRAERHWERTRFLRILNPFSRARRSRTVCLQAKLNYFNPNQNLLTRWFVVEYSTWFQLYLPGLHALRAPIPLGGTSNHFHTDVLREIGGWDPFNVTEDCDLGIRIHKLGYRTQVVDSTTWEEANSRAGNWIRQRSRWVKGYLQTHLTHMRNPLRTLWQLRPWGMFNFLNSVGGLSAMLLLNPLFWAAALVYLGLFGADLYEHGFDVEQALGVEQAIRDAGDEVHQDETVRIPHRDRHAWPIICGARPDYIPPDASWPRKVWMVVKESWDHSWHEIWTAYSGMYFWNIVSHVFFLCTIALVLGNVFFVLMHVFACIRAGRPSLIPFALFMPFYWILISVAAWKGFLQLFTDPFYWEKTQHGLDAG